MVLTKREKDLITDFLMSADGEDMEEIVECSLFSEYLLRALVLKASWGELEAIIEEKKELQPDDYV